MNIEDYNRMVYQLLPRGTAFSYAPDSTVMKIIDSFSEELMFFEEAVENVITEANPVTMVNTLDVRYEESGLPDSCRGTPPNFQERRNEVVTKWRTVGGASVNYFKSVAETYGYIIKIQDRQYPRFEIEKTQIETSGIEDAWIFTWNVNYFDTNVTFFRANQSSAGERLESPSLVNITCLFDAIKPAHTQISYTQENDLSFVDVDNRLGDTFIIGSGVIY